MGLGPLEEGVTITSSSFTRIAVNPPGNAEIISPSAIGFPVGSKADGVTMDITGSGSTGTAVLEYNDDDEEEEETRS
jgi:hypothetical protein